MANQPPAGRWMRMATLRPMPNPAQDPPSPQPPATRPVIGRTFATVPFRPTVPTVQAPVGAMPPAPVTVPPRQVTPILPSVRVSRPSSAQPAAGTNGVPPPQGALNTPSLVNGVPAPLRLNSATAATNGVPSPQRALKEVPTNIIPSPQAAPNAAINNAEPSLQSPLRAPAFPVPNDKPSPQPAPPPVVTFKSVLSPPKYEFAPIASPAKQTSPITAGNSAQRLSSTRLNSPPAPAITNSASPNSKVSFTQQFDTANSQSPKSPQQPLARYSSPAVSPTPQKQTASPPNFTSTITSAPPPRTVTFSNVQTFSSPAKPQAGPAALTPQIPSPNTSIHSDRTPPQSPKPMSLAPPPSPLHLPPPQIPSEIPQEPQQKSILFQQTSLNHNKHSPIQNHKSPQNTNHSNITTPITKPKHPHSNNTNGSIITMAGENRGAFMNLTRPQTLTTNPNPHPQFPGNPHKLTKSPNGAESDQISNGKPKSNDSVTTATRSFMNSNVQGINNSIMFNSSVTHHDPGVHVAFSRKYKGRGGGGNGGMSGGLKEHSDGHQS